MTARVVCSLVGRSSFCWLLGMSCMAAGCARDPVYERPPIIIVDIDTLRADHLGCYGYERATSPGIDAFSEESVRFEWAFAQAPDTPPSQTSILTGLYPTTHGRVRNNEVISDEVVTLAEVLQAEGYDTAAFVDDGYMDGRYGYGQGFDLYDDEAGHLRKIAPKVRRWIDRRSKSPRHPSRPFLLLIHTYDVHAPYEQTPEPHRSMFLDGLERPGESFRSRVNASMAEVWNKRRQENPPQLAPVELAWAVALYDGGIHHVDAWFGGFIGQLEKRGVLDQAIVVVVSDHGEEFQEHGSLFHDRLYATVTRIPLIIRFPQGLRRGVQSAVVESIDLMPTLLEAVGAPVPDAVQGRSLMRLIEGGVLDPRAAISESPYYGRRIAAGGVEQRMILTVHSGQRELYRYRSDPLELENLVGRHPSGEAELEGEIGRWRRRVNATRYPRQRLIDVDRAHREQLRALGYVP